MSNRMKQKVTIDGKVHWITAADTQGLLRAYLNLCIKEGVVVPGFMNRQNGSKPIPLFGEYMQQFIQTFKNNQEKITMINRDRIIRNHIEPRLGHRPINEIKTIDIQLWFDELAEKYAKETISKIRNITSPVFDAAVEDGLIDRNPMKSARLAIGGRETVHHKAIPSDKMADIRRDLDCLPLRERRMAALLSTTGMRFEQILGLRWQDFDFQRGWVRVVRAVVHPTRNMPEVKPPKTAGSHRAIPIPSYLKQSLEPIQRSGFVLSSNRDEEGKFPLSYTEARRTFDKIRQEFGIEEYSAHDFRDTCATEWRQKGIPTDVIARMLGHTKSEITQKRYVKYRSELYDGIRDVMDTICDLSEDDDTQGA